MNFFNSLRRNNKNTCLIDEKGNFYSYTRILEKIRAVKKIIKKKSLILILSSNSLDFVIFYLAFLIYKQVQIIVDENVDKTLLQNIIDKYQPSFIFSTNDKRFIPKKTKKYKITNNYIIYENKIKVQHFLNSKLSVLLSTSGSTGTTKFVKLSNANIFNNTKNITKYLKIKKNDRAITTLPLNYSYGLSIINTHIFSGASIFITKKNVFERKFWTDLIKYKISSLSGVPYFYEILKKVNFENFNLKYIKYFTQAGGPLHHKLASHFINYCQKNNKKFIIMYGQTEATSRISYLNWKYANKKISSIGKAIPGGKLTLKKKKKNDDFGELIYYGKNVSMGYSNNYNDLKKKDYNKGILKTGDLAKKDNNGFFYIIGRKNRIVKIFGHRISLDDLEKKFSELNIKCACTGKDDCINIFYTRKSIEKKIKKILLKLFKFKINNFNLQLVKYIPYSSSGKLLYSKLNE